MTIREILKNTAHRPWELSKKPWKYYQEWNDTVFLHWQVDIYELKKLIPEDIEIDLFDGKPWVSLVAFTMEKIRPKSLPSFPPVSNFNEINIRTYVKYNNKAGVYFLNIEGGTKISCKIARILSGLPYQFSKMNRQENYYHAFNSQYQDKLEIRFQVGQRTNKKTELDKWLTERYALFQENKDSINEFEIHHLEWPIYKVNLKEIRVDYPRFNTLLDNSPDATHYSTGVQVIAWDKKKHKNRR